MANRRGRQARNLQLQFSALTVQAFVSRWRDYSGSEMGGYQSHFDDLCRMLGHETPIEADPTRNFFLYQKAVEKETGQPGFADVFYKGYFAWEYKGNHKDLDAAFRQILQYRLNLENPPLLIVTDFRQFSVHTNFNNSVSREHRFSLEDLLSSEPVDGTHLSAMELLRVCFHDPDVLNPNLTPESLTLQAAKSFALLADALREETDLQAPLDPVTRKRPPLYNDDQVARFLGKIIFCLFASDVELLPKNILADIIGSHRLTAPKLAERMSNLFSLMRTGGDFGADAIKYFNGGLFSDDEALKIESRHVDYLLDADRLDWKDIEPSIFGTLFERILDPNRRRQIGAHYTSRQDIELIVRPVLMDPLERDWAKLAKQIEGMELWRHRNGIREQREKGRAALQAFLDRLAQVTILDPACGSGNFLYVSLALLKELEQKVLATGARGGIPDLTPKVHPRQLFGIEIDPYAHELASMVVWIGYLQWKHKNGIPFETESPILEPLTNIMLMDAILDLSDPEHPAEPVWPAADVIVGNPPFLGTKKMRSGLGLEYVAPLRRLYESRVPGFADFCCYWFEKARAQIASKHAHRAGLLATQGIRGGLNRVVLARIKTTGDIFFAESDRNWVLDGAAVHVSMVGFDDGTEAQRTLDGRRVDSINSNLTHNTDVTRAKRLVENARIGFVADVKAGAFDIPDTKAAEFLNAARNPNGRPNSDVIRPWVNGLDLTRRPRGMWIIDFPPTMTVGEAAMYEQPFEYVRDHVKPLRDKSNRETYKTRWWVHAEPVVAMRSQLNPLSRFIVTPTLTKHRLFAWLTMPTLPDHQLVAFARQDDYFFGVLHSHAHEVWALAQGTQLETRPRYTPTSCFETFPLPWPPGREPKGELVVTEIAAAAAELDKLRNGWLNPPGLPQEELKARTLTNLYNLRPTWLDNAHKRLDRAVFAAYGWPDELTDQEILARLLELNLKRSGA